MHAAVVEFDALADAVRPTAEHHDFLAIGRIGLAFILVGRVHVGRAGRKLTGTGVNPLVHRTHAKRMALLAKLGLARLEQIGQAPVGKPFLFQEAHFLGTQRRQLALLNSQFEIDDFLDLGKEPGIDLGQLEHLVHAHADTEGVGDIPQAIRRRDGQLFIDGFRID